VTGAVAACGRRFRERPQGADKRYPEFPLQTIQDLFKAFGFNSSNTIITCKHWYLPTGNKAELGIKTGS